MQSLGAIAFLVNDYDEAIAFFTQALGFSLVDDMPQGEGKRWVTVAPRASQGTRLLLARAVNDEQRAHVGRQGGGRVFLFLNTDDFAADHARMLAHGVRFREEPRHEPYGTVAVFEDLYGNAWDLIQPT
ncbi:VOC family protein [Luteibacter anthropi]|uniref:VOC family protein n=1 Tax=Luteibacter anthropi TaxID=564369 RepID=A0A7X5UDB5_9GAMM|nr:VOC family protein [Luteibacter anthropi]NII08123.1 VOC family protein [Luteibacter anthropi]URX64214.1 VOC family protein [Luteibacter anthropi]